MKKTKIVFGVFITVEGRRYEVLEVQNNTDLFFPGDILTREEVESFSQNFDDIIIKKGGN